MAKKTIGMLAAVSLAMGMLASTVYAEDMYIPVMAKGFEQQFWQVVKMGAEQAGEDLGVEVYFDGPASETDIDEQVNMMKNEMVKNPTAIALAALSTDAVAEVLAECAEKEIPVIGFDSGVPGDTTGAVKATAATDNAAASAMVADKFVEHETIIAALEAATPENPVVIGCLANNAVATSTIDRVTGFAEQMAKLAEEYQPGKVSVEGHTKWEKKVEDASVIIRVEISATTENTSVQTAANTLLNVPGLTAVFCTSESAVTGLLAASADGSDLMEGGAYENLVVAGFDAGTAQKNAVRLGIFYGSITQDPYMIGYHAVDMSVKAANGEEVSDLDTGAKWYDASNMDEEDIAMLLYD